MAKINRVIKQTDNRFVNLYMVEGKNKKGGDVHYSVASRSASEKAMKLKTGINTADGVSIYALYGEARDRVVLIRQYRFTIGRTVYELPAGLCEEGEDFHEAAARELHEETGLTFTPLRVDPLYEAPRFTTVGMTDESVATVYGYASGEISGKFAEDIEEIQVVLADRDEVRRILKEEWVAMQCAYQLMHFLHDDEPFAFLEAD